MWLLVWSGIALALDSRRELSQFSHEVWLTENGLPQNTVHSIAQASDGYIWIGTEEGLARFDGVKFTVFNEQRDHSGKLWVGTCGGLTESSQILDCVPFGKGGDQGAVRPWWR